jgi:hypothetical protein
VRDAAVTVRRKTQREQAAARGARLDRLVACAADPAIHAFAERIDALTSERNGPGGRRRANPTWAMLVFGAGVSVFGSQSATARELACEHVWQAVARTVQDLGPGHVIPSVGPSRDHYQYFLRRLTPVKAQLIEAFCDAAALRAQQVGLADPATASITNPDRPHTLVIDGKVFSSPQAHHATERIDRLTGEIRPIRQDPARGQHREGGRSDAVWGAKYALASIRSPLPGHRVITGIQQIEDGKGRGESGAFVDLALAACRAMPGISAVITDGALRGTAINQIQQATGAVVVSPPRNKAAKNGGIKIGDKYHPGKPLPLIPAHLRGFADCAGHDLWGIGGTMMERITTADGTTSYQPVTRRQTKRGATRSGTYALFAQHQLPCRHGAAPHTWYEPLTTVGEDASNGFNRAEYLRAIPRSDDEYGRIYGMRADSESLNAQLEYAFHKNRLPAWGEDRQTLTLLFAALAFNSWALQRWQHEVRAQSPPPAEAA